MLVYLLFAAGLLLVWKGADFLIEGSAGLARRLGVRAFIVGLTVVSFGTSAPELVVNVIAAHRGASALALGNVMGSNVANLLLVLGLAALLARPMQRAVRERDGVSTRPKYGVSTHRATVHWELPATILATLLIAALIYLPAANRQLSRADGLVLLALFGLFLLYVYRLALSGMQPTPITKGINVPRGIVQILGGVAALGLGAHWLVANGLEIAARFGLTEGYIGFVLIAIGTSLPELAATVSAAVKGHEELAVGNILGSNLFNLLFVLGVTAVLRPLAPGPDTPLQIGAAAAAPLAVLILLLAGRLRLGRVFGALLLTSYVGYLVWLALHVRT